MWSLQNKPMGNVWFKTFVPFVSGDLHTSGKNFASGEQYEIVYKKVKFI